jgi:hypothetical protein
LLRLRAFDGPVAVKTALKMASEVKMEVKAGNGGDRARGNDPSGCFGVWRAFESLDELHTSLGKGNALHSAERSWGAEIVQREDDLVGIGKAPLGRS